jgi:hypothetical protein
MSRGYFAKLSLAALGVLASSQIGLAQAVAADEGTTSKARSSHLTLDVGECPKYSSEGTTSQGFMPAGPVAGALVSSVASHFAGQAVDAAVRHLSQNREFTSTGAMALTPEMLRMLFHDDRASEKPRVNKCLYVYLYTIDLWRYFNPGKVSPSANGAERLTIEDTLAKAESLDEIAAKRLTRFLVAIHFAPSKHPPMITKDSMGDINANYLYFRPYFYRVIYPDFIDSKCPALRRCDKRDVAIQISLRYPVAPDPSKTQPKAYPYGNAFENVSSQAVASTLNRQYSAWFAVNTMRPELANLDFTLVETSKPGEFAKAVAAALQSNKESLVKVVTP